MPTARDQLFLDLFTTAMEGGIGYWSRAAEYHWMCDDDAAGADFIGFYAVIRDMEADEGEERQRIDRSVIATGYGLASAWPFRDSINWSSEPPPLVVTDDTDWDFDAGDADCIVQLGLFGEVRYG